MSRSPNRFSLEKHPRLEKWTAVTILAALTIAADFGLGQLTAAHFDADDAQTLVQQSGYTKPVLQETDLFLVGFDDACTVNEFAEFKFEATDQTGHKIGVQVCKGLFDEATINNS